MTAMDRRSFLRGALVVSAASMLPSAAVKALELLKPLPTLWGDGMHDDTEALQAFLDGTPFRTADGFAGSVETGTLQGGRFRLTKTLWCREFQPTRTFLGCHFDIRGLPDDAYFIAAECPSRGNTLSCDFGNEPWELAIKAPA